MYKRQGLKRLGFESRIHQLISSEISLHAVGQGALGIECKKDDHEIIKIINVLIIKKQIRDV